MKTDLRIQKTRVAVQNALFDLLGEKELSKISISELCRRAQINRKTFYRHYRGTEDIIEELENALLAELSAILRRGNNSIFDIGAVFRDISATIEKNQDVLIKVMRLNPELLTGGKIKAMMCRATALSLKSAGTASGAEADVAAEFAVSGVLAIYSAWLNGGCKGDLDMLTEISAKMTAHGLTAFVSDDKLAKMQF